MGTASAPWASSARPACGIRVPSPPSTARRRRCRESCAIKIEPMADEPVTDPAERAPGATDAPDPLHDLQRERDDYYDRWVRKTAEFDNYRKRLERERREQADQAVTDLILELLSAVDDFDRA